MQVDDLIRINTEVEEDIRHLELCKFSGHTFRKHVEKIQRTVVHLEELEFSNLYAAAAAHATARPLAREPDASPAAARPG